MKRMMYESYKRLHSDLMGPKTVSNFQVSGTLTPKEFIEAGDALVQKMPVWEWASGPADILPYLPPDKKYLVQRHVTCFERPSGGAADVPESSDGEWVETYPGHQSAPRAAAAQPKEINWNDDDDDEDADAADEGDLAERPCRLYNVYVVYDTFYQTPRIYLDGYSDASRKKQLTRDEMMEDIFAANREKTVTIDAHPFLNVPCISIHPCRHAETMKRIIQQMREKYEEAEEEAVGPSGAKEPFVFPSYLSLFVFLKFISSVVPTIQYDISVGMDFM